MDENVFKDRQFLPLYGEQYWYLERVFDDNGIYLATAVKTRLFLGDDKGRHHLASRNTYSDSISAYEVQASMHDYLSALAKEAKK